MIADFFSALLYRIRTLFRRSAAQQELDDEIRFHMQCEVDKHIAEGRTSTDAVRLARLSFGSVESFKEESRGMWGFQWLEHTAQDLRFAARRLRQRPGFTASVIGVLALGIGATTAMFSAVDAALLRPLPFPEPQQLVRLRNVNIPFEGPSDASAKGRILDIADAAALDLFTGVAGAAAGGLNLSDPERPIRVNVGVVTADFFETLGVRPARGRGFLPEEGAPNGPSVAVISHELWLRHFGGRDIARETLPLNGKAYTIVGVMPSGIRFPNESDLWIPMSVPMTAATFEPFRGWIPSSVIARLGPGVSIETASTRLMARWEQLLPPPVPGQRSNSRQMVEELRRLGPVSPLQKELVGDRRTPLLVLLGATGFLLMIACANVTNLLLSDGTSRQREIALRHVLGASRGRIVRQLLAESLLLAMAGAIAGIALAPVALRMMRALLPENLAGVAPAQIDLRVLAFATCLALITGIAFGLWPALRTTRQEAAGVIKRGSGHGATAESSSVTRRVLVGAELALTVMLLVGAALMLRSFSNLMALDLGMNPERAATLEMTVPRGLDDDARRIQRIEAIIERVASTQGIDAAGAVNNLPLRGGGGIGFPVTADGMPKPLEFSDRVALEFRASGGYFRALGIPIERGRTFSSGDAAPRRPGAIVNTAMANRFWPDVDPLGRTFRIAGDSAPVYTVIGIAADVRSFGIHTEPGPQMYLPLNVLRSGDVAIVARGSLPPDVLLRRLTEAVRAVDPSQAVYNVRMMEDVVGASVAPRRTQTLLIAAFGALALVLAAFGVYAVVAYGVTQRSRELGIRAALGATRGNLMNLVAREMLVVTTVGLLAGLAGAWMLSRVMSGLVYGVEVRDPKTFVAVSVVLALSAAVATLMPARRATRVDPIEVMRAE